MFDKETMDQIKQAVKETQKENEKSISFSWRWFVPIVTSAFIAVLPFWGYLYLKALLEAHGFESPNISPSIYQLWEGALFVIFYTAAKLPIPDPYQMLIWFVVILVLVSLVPTIVIRQTYKEKYYPGRTKKYFSTLTEFDIERLLRSFRLTFKQKISLFGYFLFKIFEQSFIFFAVAYLIYPVLLILILTAAIGIFRGDEIGEDEMKEIACIESDWKPKEVKRGYRFNCAQIKIGDKMVSGKRLYSDDKSTFFITNDMAYQVGFDGKILYQRKIERINQNQ